MQKDS